MRPVLFSIVFMAFFVFDASIGMADITPVVNYFPILPIESSPDTAPQLVPLAANHPLDGPHAGMTRAIIIIHDATRDANTGLALLSTLAGTANANTLIIAPEFLLPSDLARFATLPNKERIFATWSMDSWPQGDDSTPLSGQKTISSFSVVDLLLMYLSDARNFPDLRDIVITGFGAGANFTQHYATFGRAINVLSRGNINLSFLVVSAPFYLYLTATRPLGGRKGFGQPDSTSCPDYDSYPYGLNKLNSYTHRVGANAAKTDYVTRHIFYINGVIADPVSDANCALTIQGNNTVSRFNNYQLYLQSIYGDALSQRQTFAIVNASPNDANTLFGSPCGMAILFGDGVCLPPLNGAH